MQTRKTKERGAKAAPVPEVIDRAGEPVTDETPEARPTGPTDRDERGNPIDWSRPETLRSASGMWVAIWFLVPLIAILLYGYFTR